MHSWTRLAAAALLLASTAAAPAAERTLTLYYFATTRSPGVGHATLDFIKRVNDTGKGKIQINTTLKDPSSIPTAQAGTALKNGIIDIAVAPPSYFSRLAPGVEGLSAVNVPPSEQRKNGAYKLINSYFEKHVNAHFLAQTGYGSTFHIFTTVPVKTLADFKGLRLRSSRTYKSFFEALGAQPVLISRSEIFTALERGVVKGYANPIVEVKLAGWADITKYRIDPGFYQSVLSFLVNKKTWDSLNDEQKEVLNKAGQWLEDVRSEEVDKTTADAAEELKKHGVQTLTLPPEQADKFVAMANAATWDAVIKEAPEFGPAVKKLVLH